MVTFTVTVKLFLTDFRRISIRTTTIKSTPVDLRQSGRKSALGVPKLKRRSQKRLLRYSILAVNVVLLLAVIGFVVKHPSSTQAVQRTTLDSSAAQTAVSPLDSLSSADIAAHVARVTNLPEANAVANQADSVSAQLAITPADNNVIAKPQVVTTAVKSRRDIQTYIVKTGDTVPSLATKFGITSETIKSSNMLTSDNLSVGQQLIISPVDGIAYKVKNGDTVDSLAVRYGASKDQIVAFNDTELSGLPVGQYIVIPNGRTVAQSSSSSPSLGLRLFGGGGYDAGWCTAYASAKAGVPGGWGNANTWHIYAPLSGWTVSTVPRVGAVAQTSVGWAGHVGIVEAVSPDGTMIKYSDMNGLAGFNRVGYSDWVPTIGKYQRFIYH